MWDLPRPGLEPVFPALAGRFSTTAPPGKPQDLSSFWTSLMWSTWSFWIKKGDYFSFKKKKKLPSTPSILGLPPLKRAMEFASRHISSASYFLSEAREEEEWGLGAQYTREIEPWRTRIQPSSAPLLPRFLPPALLFSLHRRFFTSGSHLVLLLLTLWFIAPIVAWNSPWKCLLKEKWILLDVQETMVIFWARQARPRVHLEKKRLHTWPDPLPECLKDTVLLSPYLAVSVHEHFQKSVIKDIGNFPKIFPPTALALSRLPADRGKGRVD